MIEKKWDTKTKTDEESTIVANIINKRKKLINYPKKWF